MKITPTLSCLFGLFIILLSACHSDQRREKDSAYIAFIDYVQDETLAKAKEGFFKALADSGYSEEQKSLRVLYRNAQGDQPTLLQAIDYAISEKPVLIATNPTLPTISAVQRTKTIPIVMMVSPRPDLAKLTDKDGKAPANLFGVYETLDYIDTSVTLIQKLIPAAKRVGTIYSQSESQSVDALNKLKEACQRLGLELIAMPVSNSAETQLITQSILNQGVDVFFALPDNVIFASFESVVNACNAKHIPILTSEAGLVKRGALASYGADFFAWGYQAGVQAVSIVRNGNTENMRPEEVQLRLSVYNPDVAKRYGITVDQRFSPVK